MQSINHQIGVGIDAVVGFPGVGVVAGLNGLIVRSPLCRLKRVFGVAEVFCVVLSGVGRLEDSPNRWQAIVLV